MKITYDREVDALYIRFKETTVTTEHLAEGIAADYDADGHLVGIEILDAMQRLGDSDYLPTNYSGRCCFRESLRENDVNYTKSSKYPRVRCWSRSSFRGCMCTHESRRMQPIRLFTQRRTAYDR